MNIIYTFILILVKGIFSLLFMYLRDCSHWAGTMRLFTPLLMLAIASGCTRTSVMPLAADTIVITAHAALVCGSAGAQDAAVKHAAIETIRHGYDSFIVLDGQTENTARVIGYTPTVAQTTGNAVATVGPGVITATGQATTTYSGGVPIIGGHHGQSLTIKMFHDGDPAGANAIAAKTLLGPDWQKSLDGGSRGSCP